MKAKQSLTLIGGLCACFSVLWSGLGTSTALATPGQGHAGPWGITIVAEPPVPPRDLPGDPYAAASVVATNNPDDFGYPTVVGRTVILPAVSDAAIALTASDASTRVEKLGDYGNNRAQKAGAPPLPTLELGQSLAQVKLVAAPTSRSVAQMNALNDQVFDLQADPAYADAGIVSAGIDGNGQILLTVHRLTDNLAAAIAQRFGTTDIVVQEDSSFAWSSTADVAVVAPASVVPFFGFGADGWVWPETAARTDSIADGH